MLGFNVGGVVFSPDQITTYEGINSILILVFGLLFVDKANDEIQLMRASDRLTMATSRTKLGWALRNKGLTLAWLVGLLGVVFLVRGVIGLAWAFFGVEWTEPIWLTFTLRTGAVAALVANKVWRHRTRTALNERLAEVLEGQPTPSIWEPRDLERERKTKLDDTAADLAETNRISAQRTLRLTEAAIVLDNDRNVQHDRRDAADVREKVQDQWDADNDHQTS